MADAGGLRMIFATADALTCGDNLLCFGRRFFIPAPSQPIQRLLAHVSSRLSSFRSIDCLFAVSARRLAAAERPR